jgi:hypothetical protein
MCLSVCLSRAQLTKWRADVKAKLEDDFREGGQRTAKQVLGTFESLHCRLYPSCACFFLCKLQALRPAFGGVRLRYGLGYSWSLFGPTVHLPQQRAAARIVL